MLLIEILGLPHCPRNRSHFLSIVKGNKGRMVPTSSKTEMAREYEKAILSKLHMNYTFQAEEFRNSFDKETQHIVAIWEFVSPEVLTKSGKVSENGTDLDAHKVLQDTIFEFIGIDDAYIMRDTRSKCQGDYAVKLDLRICNNDGSHLL